MVYNLFDVMAFHKNNKKHSWINHIYLSIVIVMTPTPIRKTIGISNCTTEYLRNIKVHKNLYKVSQGCQLPMTKFTETFRNTPRPIKQTETLPAAEIAALIKIKIYGGYTGQIECTEFRKFP